MTKCLFTLSKLAIFSLVFMIVFGLGPILGYFFYAVAFKRAIRLIRFENKRIKVNRDWVIHFVYQFKVDVPIEKIMEITFDHIAGNSHGEPIPRTYCSPCLKLVLEDGNTEVIMMIGFSKKQYLKVEQTLLEINPKILVKTSAKEFISTYTIY